jgi:predicted DNA-binding protein
MEMLPITSERKAQLEDYARRRGQSAADALDEMIATHLEWEREDYEESIEAIREGNESVEAGRTRSAEMFLEELRMKHGFSR